MRFMIVSLFLFLFSIGLSMPVAAAELSGTVFSQGSPVANLTIKIKETDKKTKTGPKGEYQFDLPPGQYTLIVRGHEFPMTVGSDPTHQDIQL